MKQRKGLLLITIPLLITALLWLIDPGISFMSWQAQLFYIVGALSVTGFALVFLLSIRNKRIETWFNGLEHLYVTHKWLSIVSLLLVFLHANLREFVGGGYESVGAKLGSLAQNGFVVLILIALFAKRLKYENWRMFHRLMLIPFIFGAYHMLLSSPIPLLTLSPIGIWSILVVLVGTASSLYMLFFYRSLGFKYKGKVTELTRLNASALELVMTVNKPMPFKQGQYAFVRLFQKGLESAPHPFSISGIEGNTITITVKALGDFSTKVVNELKTNAKVSLDGPYGHMDLNAGKAKQVWVAGGVGITPFISYLRDSDPSIQVDLYYSYRGEKEGLYTDLLTKTQRSNPNFRFHAYDTSKVDRLSVESISADEETTIFMCGPQKMIDTYAIQLKDKFKNTEIIYEAFKLAR
jgi:predicted ferric reductase